MPSDRDLPRSRHPHRRANRALDAPSRRPRPRRQRTGPGPPAHQHLHRKRKYPLHRRPRHSRLRRIRNFHRSRSQRWMTRAVCALARVSSLSPPPLKEASRRCPGNGITRLLFLCAQDPFPALDLLFVEPRKSCPRGPRQRQKIETGFSRGGQRLITHRSTFETSKRRRTTDSPVPTSSQHLA